MNIEEEVKKIIPDFFEYYLDWEIKGEYESIEDFVISTLEHELDLYDNWKVEGFKNQQEVSYIKKENVKEVRKLIREYYKK